MSETSQSGMRLHPTLRMLNIGYGNLIMVERIVAIISPHSSPIRRLREEASKDGRLVDATQGRRTRSILITDSNHIVLSAINPETILSRIANEDGVDDSKADR